jgi:2-keto-4-pentenoate hydratase/2-oxohepta-3-ene-1,7-dioic acid hydratase in catechol pathway
MLSLKYYFWPASGTPEGVGPIEPGDVLTAGMGGIVEVEFTVSGE